MVVRLVVDVDQEELLRWLRSLPGRLNVNARLFNFTGLHGGGALTGGGPSHCSHFLQQHVFFKGTLSFRHGRR